MVPDDHPYSFLSMRSSGAFKRCRSDHRPRHPDELHHWSCLAATLWAAHAKIARIDIDPDRDRCRRPLRRHSRSSATARCRPRQQLLDRLHQGPHHAGQLRRRGARPSPTGEATKRSAAGRQPNTPMTTATSTPLPHAAKRNCAISCQARRHPRVLTGRRSLNFRAADDADLRTGPSSEFGPVRHHGCRHAVRRSAPRSPSPDKQVIVRAWRRLDGAERDGAGHRHPPQASPSWW